MPHTFSRACGSCGCLTEHRQRDFDRRVERLTVVRHEGKPLTSVEISQSEQLHAYCDKDCWTAAEPALVLEFELRSTYPRFAFVSSCCRCGASVDRTHYYVCLSVAKMSYQQDGGPVAICSGHRDWAVLCNSCDHPDAPELSAIANDIDTSVPEFA